jgi:cobalt-zinc-cadmium efflux system membrane fusion protein
MSRHRFRLLEFYAVAVAAFAGAHSPEVISATNPPAVIRLSEPQARAAGVKVDEAREAHNTDAPLDTSGLRLTGSVTVPPNDTGVIVSAVSGQVERVFVHIGQSIRRGDQLARIYSADVLSMQRNYLHATSSVSMASDRLTRDETLFREGIIAEARLREAQATRDMAVATQREQRRLLRLAGYSDTEIDSLKPDSISAWITLRSANNGVLLEQPALVGQHIEAGTTLFRLATGDRWWLELEATRAQAADIRLGDFVRVDGCSNDGHVIAVASQLQAASQTLTIRAEMSEDLTCVIPNQYVQARVRPSMRDARLVSIPASALIRNGNAEFIFVQKAGNFQPTPVKVARRQGNEVLLSGGVEPGARVASSGLIALKGAWLGLGVQPGSAGVQ